MSNGDAIQFVVCIPLACGRRWPGFRAKDIENRLDQMRTDVAFREMLDATECIHFMSMSVVWDGAVDAKPLLVLDITGDGTRRSVIDALLERAGPKLLTLFEGSPEIRSLAHLARCLDEWSLLAAASPFTEYTGLRFAGTPELSVKRIREDDKIEQLARAAVERAREGIKQAHGKKAQDPAARRDVNHPSSVEFLSTLQGEGAKKDPRPLDVLEYVRRTLNTREIAFKLPDGQSGRWDRQRATREAFTTTLVGLVSRSWILQLLLFLSAVMFLMLLQEYLSKEEQVSLFEALVAFWMALSVSVVMMLVALGIGAGLLYRNARAHEKTYKPIDEDPDPDLMREILRRENIPLAARMPEAAKASNHLTAVSRIHKKFWLSRVALPLAFHVVELLSTSGIFKRGFLASIGTIHFAQWVRLPGNKLLFVSNYDGSWESYLEDFITKASEGLTGIWSNTEGFPRTKQLYLEGAQDGDRFKRYVRRQQIPTLFWYAAYPTLTVEQIRNNVDIRAGLTDAKGETDAKDWLAKFGSAPRPRYAVEAREIQTIAYSGLRDLADGACLLLRFPADTHDVRLCNRWLEKVRADVGFGAWDNSKGDRQLFVALSWRGLEKLGLSRTKGEGFAALAAEFPSAFVMGMNHPSRQDVLGDTGDSDPSKWRWGGAESEVDAALLLYAQGDAPNGKSAIEDAIDKAKQELASFGVTVLNHGCVRFQSQPLDAPKVEPFGFVDGVSQPIVRGFQRAPAAASGIDVVETGEFILGYPDERDCYPPTPQVDKEQDKENWLPSLPQDFIAFSDDVPDQARRDIGRNGSFLVVRQLHQHVDRFNAFLDTQAKMLAPQLEEVDDARKWLAAKLVGRWQNGASLVRYPDRPPAVEHYTSDDNNSFLFGREDPQGHACPFGAHIRRANPRDSLDPEDKRQMGITNRHRLLRRGRPYLPDGAANGKAKGDVKPEGLFFMCLNGDIERQYEFVQQTWMHSNSLRGLRDETDPFASQPRACPAGGEFTIPYKTGPVRVKGLGSFVTVVGGAYFFLPSRRALAFLASLGNPAKPA